ncbi:30S ribosomal protein S21, chloroplastic-like [Olea europaea var. sylvestris]|uniref:30S ribosomal S21, chloroplastic-like n=1 Tax=Olea europaea subsp. europaea TaxID=158383 RepID=A0A8S0RHN0_OLEEU|nr:30S ribosomal protein S21, chloroplastic-like [Olea europaea var. sylvestris]CAA2978750.1 30S ribosomal S21, chloroplastic-like [Olea europaea subsp. europaea]
MALLKLAPIYRPHSPLPHTNFKPLLQPKTHVLIPVILAKLPAKTHKEEDPYRFYASNVLLHQAFDKPILFKRSWNVQILTGVNEPEEKLVGRFRREVLKAGVLQECKRRRFFESTQQKKKRKTREAAKRKMKRPRQSKASVRVKKEDLKKKDDSEDDNWEIFDVDLPYC